MTNETLKDAVKKVVQGYSVKSVLLFGSRASESNREDSDVDLIIEFYEPVSLLTLSMIKLRLEELLELNVDLIHGPIEADDMIEVGKVVELYAA